MFLGKNTEFCNYLHTFRENENPYTAPSRIRYGTGSFTKEDEVTF